MTKDVVKEVINLTEPVALEWVQLLDDMASQQSKMATLRTDLQSQRIRADAAETLHARLMKCVLLCTP